MRLLHQKNMPKGTGCYDAVIAGAGPGGCSTALNLPHDMRILIVDKSSFPRNKVCGGVLLESSCGFMKKIGLEPPANVFAQPSELYMKISDFDNHIETDFKRSFCNVRREAFDKWLLGTCADNVDFLPGCQLESLVRRGEKFTSEIRSVPGTYSLESGHFADSTGASSFSRTSAGMRMPIYVAYQEWVRGAEQDYFGISYCNRITDYYIWTIPKDGYTLVGTAFPPSGVKSRIDEFRKFIRNDMKLGGDVLKSEVCPIMKPAVGDLVPVIGGVMLVGEAAGFVDPNTGEGISSALLSGSFCAQSIKECPDAPSERYARLCGGIIKNLNERMRVFESRRCPSGRLEMFGSASGVKDLAK